MLTCSYSVLTYYFWMKHSSTVKKDWIELYNLQMRSIELYKFCTQIGTMPHFGLTFFTFCCFVYVLSSLRKQATFHNATTCFPAKINDFKEMTKEIPYWQCITTQLWVGDASDWLASSSQKHYPDMPHASSAWFSVVVSQISFHRKTSAGVAKCYLFSQITSYHTDLIFYDAAWWQLQSKEC